jgi:hypothetical protein
MQNQQLYGFLQVIVRGPGRYFIFLLTGHQYLIYQLSYQRIGGKMLTGGSASLAEFARRHRRSKRSPTTGGDQAECG